ncbi:MAG: hypothetical protein E7254_05570 [Lachnospiraceae bacterium]|nr:hypothetical protein [Lachnospiraceae bacterium]
MNKRDKLQNGLNEAFSDIAPDILDKILMQDIKPVESLENDLRDEPVFKQQKKKSRIWVPSMATSIVSACVIMFVAILGIIIIPMNNKAYNTVACTITFDINPSINIGYNKKGDIIKIEANNKDAVKVVDKINKKLNKKMENSEKIDVAMSVIRKSGYLKNKKSVVLVSANVSEKNSIGVIKGVKSDIATYRENSHSDFTAVYQKYEENEKVDKLAKKKGISKGKAAYCIKVSKEVKEKPVEMAELSVSKITKKYVDATKKNNTEDDTIIVDEYGVETPDFDEAETLSVDDLEIETESGLESDDVDEVILDEFETDENGEVESESQEAETGIVIEETESLEEQPEIPTE